MVRTRQNEYETDHERGWLKIWKKKKKTYKEARELRSSKRNQKADEQRAGEEEEEEEIQNSPEPSTSSQGTGQPAISPDDAVRLQAKIEELEQQHRKMNRLIQELICGLCHDVVRDPVQLSCGHSMCLACTKRLFRHQQKCPICNGATTSVTRNFMVKNVVDRIVEMRPELKHPDPPEEEEEPVREAAGTPEQEEHPAAQGHDDPRLIREYAAARAGGPAQPPRPAPPPQLPAQHARPVEYPRPPPVPPHVQAPPIPPHGYPLPPVPPHGHRPPQVHPAVHYPPPPRRLPSPGAFRSLQRQNVADQNPAPAPEPAPIAGNDPVPGVAMEEEAVADEMEGGEEQGEEQAPAQQPNRAQLPPAVAEHNAFVRDIAVHLQWAIQEQERAYEKLVHYREMVGVYEQMRDALVPPEPAADPPPPVEQQQDNDNAGQVEMEAEEIDVMDGPGPGQMDQLMPGQYQEPMVPLRRLLACEIGGGHEPYRGGQMIGEGSFPRQQIAPQCQYAPRCGQYQEAPGGQMGRPPMNMGGQMAGQPVPDPNGQPMAPMNPPQVAVPMNVGPYQPASQNAPQMAPPLPLARLAPPRAYPVAPMAGPPMGPQMAAPMYAGPYQPALQMAPPPPLARMGPPRPPMLWPPGTPVAPPAGRQMAAPMNGQYLENPTGQQPMNMGGRMMGGMPMAGGQMNPGQMNAGPNGGMIGGPMYAPQLHCQYPTGQYTGVQMRPTVYLPYARNPPSPIPQLPRGQMNNIQDNYYYP